MSYYAMALLLDETTYRKKQAEIFDLLKSLKVENPLALYGVLRDEMEKSAPAPKWVITRIWQVHTGTIRAPETIKPEVPEKIGHAVGKIANRHPDRDKNVAENNRLSRFAIAIWKIKRRILGD